MSNFISSNIVQHKRGGSANRSGVCLLIVLVCGFCCSAHKARAQGRSGLPRVHPNNSRTAGQVALDEGRFSDAIQHLNIVVSEVPDDAQTWLLLGRAYQLSGQWDDAIATYREAGRFGRTQGAAFFSIAKVYALMKDEAQTLQALQEAVEAGFRQVDFRDDAEFAFISDVTLFQSLAEQALPAAYREEYRELDFWRGSWQIVDARTGEELATSNSESMSDPFLIHEVWQGAEYSGRRICYFEPNAGHWKMLILTPGYQAELTGKLSAGSFGFEGELHRIDGTIAPVAAEVSQRGDTVSFRLRTLGHNGEELQVLADWEYRPPQSQLDGDLTSHR